MDNLRDHIKHVSIDWLDKHFPAYAELVYGLGILLWIGLFSVFVHWVLHRVVLRLLDKNTLVGRAHWARMLFEHKLFSRIALALQGGIIYSQAGLWLDPSSPLRKVIEQAAEMWMLIFALLSVFSLLDTFQDLASEKSRFLRFPFRGLVQSTKLIASAIIGLIIISLLMGKSPLILLSGLGAISAVLMLVFKDPILGLVAGIQLSANDMLSIGDWLEMPKYGADGDVIDIGLTTVKVRNFDKTITTIPTHALIDDSFINWRGMSESGGRRIKRSILIDTNSVRFLTEDDLERLGKAQLLTGYLSETVAEIQQHNTGLEADLSSLINGRRLTNLGTLRAYLMSYLKQHPKIHQRMTLMVRQLEPTPHGLPLQIYAFTNTTRWAEYEGIQSDIFDHLFAVLPEFDLRVHEAPTGMDLRALAASQPQVQT